MGKDRKIIIVEDEVLIAEFIRDMLHDEEYQYVEVAHDCNSALEICKTFNPEIALLDINIEGRDSGINLVKQLNSEVKIIYITAQNDESTIQKAIATNPITYLTKPVKKSDVVAALKLASFKLKNNYIVVKEGYSESKIYFDSILFVKSDGNYIEVITETKKYVLRQSLDSFLNDLNSSLFIKVHRSYIVNKEKIKLKKSNAIFINDIEIPISRNFVFNL